MSASTSAGCRNAPTRFLPCRALIPVLPPTLESTCASSEVGTCTKLHAAPRDRRREAGEVADHAAAERHHHVVPLAPRLQNRLDHRLQALEALRCLARRHDDFGAVDSGRLQRCPQRRKVKLRHVRVGDDRRRCGQGRALRSARRLPRSGPGRSPRHSSARRAPRARSRCSRRRALSPRIGVERRDDVADDRLVRPLARGDDDVGEAIDRLALGQKLAA